MKLSSHAGINRTHWNESSDEYQALHAASTGARSLSEFARARLLDGLGGSAIDAQLSELKNTVKRIEQMLEKN